MNREQRRRNPVRPAPKISDEKREEFAEKFTDKFIERALGDRNINPEPTDPDLLDVLAAIAENTDRIARALEGRDQP